MTALQNPSESHFLHLDQTLVSIAGLTSLQKFPALEHITLYSFSLNEEGIQNLMKLPNLKSLGVTCVHESFPDIPSRGAANRELKEQLRKALPNCKIH